MIESVRNYLSNFGKVDEKIIEAIRKNDRKFFVPEKYKDSAYIDSALPIGQGQTISQPSTVARMISLLKLKDRDDVLEVGTGSGWNACVIAFIVKKGKILSLEVVRELADKADKKIKAKNIKIMVEDFRKIKEKFDKIIFTAGILPEQEKIIENFAKNHLNENGILVCPFQSGPLVIIKKKRAGIEKRYTNEGYVFVPLVL